MKPAIVFPMNDPSGVTFRFLRDVVGDLADLFEKAYVCITPSVQAAQEEHVRWMESNELFSIISLEDGLPVGDLFATLYRRAAAAASDDQVLHLCFADRLVYTLQSAHRDAFMTDIRALPPEETPLIYQRSEAAWASHPRNYRDIEGMVTKAGELLFGNRLDYAWCHLALMAADLTTALDRVNRTDLAMVAEMLLPILVRTRTKDVDWLAWEDPFILGADAAELKSQRENSIRETEKRLSYAIPMLQLLQAEAKNETR